MSLVFDSSTPLAWIDSDEVTDAIRQFFDTVELVPAPLRMEVANSLTVAMKQRRIDAEFRRAALADLMLLNIKAGTHTDVHA